LYSVLIDGDVSEPLNDDADVDGADVDAGFSFFDFFGVADPDFVTVLAPRFFAFVGITGTAGEPLRSFSLVGANALVFGFADLAFGDLPFFPLRQDLHQLCGITSICALRRVLNNSRTFRIPVADVPHFGHSACIAFPMCQSSIR
jgi:hypothetical protein